MARTFRNDSDYIKPYSKDNRDDRKALARSVRAGVKRGLAQMAADAGVDIVLPMVRGTEGRLSH